MLRIVTGRINKIDGTPWQTEAIIRLFPGSWDAIAQYPQQKKKITTDVQGLFSVELWCNEGGLSESRYEFAVGKEIFYFSLPTGTGAIDIGELRDRQAWIPPQTGNEPITREITQSDLVGSETAIAIGARVIPCAVDVINDLNDEVAATNIRYVNGSAVISLEGYLPITGTWRIRVL